MNVVVAGGTGFIGTKLVQTLLETDHTVTILTTNPKLSRRVHRSDTGPVGPGRAEFVYWNPSNAGEAPGVIDGAEAVVNLAGVSIAGGLWTARRKEKILRSRLDATRTIVRAIAQARSKPRVLASASAVGYYGHVEEAPVTEDRPPGHDFLADVCIRWEEAAREAEKSGVRVVLLRTGIVLEKHGGALQRMALPFKLFAGGPLGSGDQWFPWIHLGDEVGAIIFALENSALAGPVNLAAPEPATMREFCTALGRAMRRPSWAPVPAALLKILLGEMSTVILSGQRLIPKKLLDAGYRFRYPRLQEALGAILQ